MARVNNLSNFLTDVASAIKTKKGSETAIPAANFDTEILALPSQGVYQTKTINITTNGIRTITPDQDFDAIEQLNLSINVPIASLQTKSVEITSNGLTQILPDVGYDGFSQLSLNVNIPTEDLTAELNAQDILIQQLQQALANKIAGSSEPNIFIQTTEPEKKRGIWIKSSTFAYSILTSVSNKTNVLANAINFFVNPHTYHNYKTVLVDGTISTGMNYEFDEVYITDANANILYDISIYYGNGTNWVECTPIDAHYIGIDVDFANGTISRVVGNSTSVNDLKCYKNRLRCNLQNDGAVTAYYNDNDYDDIGSEDLQVMVEQPAVWYSLQDVVLSGNTITSCKYMVADGPMDGYELHPAFIKGNTTFDKLYEPAFEATLVNDKLSSIGGGTTTPYVNATRGTFRTKASNRGTGWQQLTKMIQDLDNLLIAIEYVSFDTQSSIANGIVNSSAAQAIGQIYVLDNNGTGFLGEDKTASVPFTWRYRENIWGNVWKWLDGINILSYVWYFANENYVDDTSTNYTKALVNAPSSNGYITRFAYNTNAKWLFEPATVDSSETRLIKDYYYHSSGNRVFDSGGSWYDDGSRAGAFFSDVSYSSSYASSFIGGGLVYYNLGGEE